MRPGRSATASPVVPCEIGSTDSGLTAEFSRQVFGWQTVAAGPTQFIIGGHEGGPTGMLNTLGHPPDNYILMYSRADDLDAALARVTDAGGSTVVGLVALPDGRRFAWVKNTAG